MAAASPQHSRPSLAPVDVSGTGHVVAHSTPHQGRLRRLTADPRVQSAWRAASSVASHSRQAIVQLSSQVNADDRASAHSALQASQFGILDLYSGAEDLAAELKRVEAEEQRVKELLEARRQGCCTLCCIRLKQRFVTFTTAPSSWIFLIILGILAAGVAYLVDAPVAALSNVRYTATANSGGGGYFTWVLWCVAFALLSAVLGHLVPLSEGSGIPQIKAILGGTNLGEYLSLRVAAAKIAGLIAALASGLSVGKEGPFVHIAAALASTLARLPYFSSSVGRNESLRRQALAAAVAAGVTAVFGTPVGGVLFSIEVTSTYFLTSMYARCFITAIVCRFAFDVIGVLRSDTSFQSTRFPGGSLSIEVLAFASLGALCGLLGSLFVYCVNKVRIARALLMTTTRRRYLLVSLVALLVSSATYITVYTRKSDRSVINDLFADEASSPDGQADMGDWSSPSVLVSLAVYFGIKFACTVVSISLPVACGLFIPLFVLGAVTGRFFGEVLRLLFPSATQIVPGAYAVVGAAALTSGATQTISTALIVFELTGQMSYLLPVLLAVLVATSVSSLFTVSVYDLLLVLAGLPSLSRVLPADSYRLTARDIMRPVPLPMPTPRGAGESSGSGGAGHGSSDGDGDGEGPMHVHGASSYQCPEPSILAAEGSTGTGSGDGSDGHGHVVRIADLLGASKDGDGEGEGGDTGRGRSASTASHIATGHPSIPPLPSASTSTRPRAPFLTLSSTHADAKALLSIASFQATVAHSPGSTTAPGRPSIWRTLYAALTPWSWSRAADGAVPAPPRAFTAPSAATLLAQKAQEFPVVTNDRDMVLVGSVSRAALEALLRRHRLRGRGRAHTAVSTATAAPAGPSSSGTGIALASPPVPVPGAVPVSIDARPVLQAGPTSGDDASASASAFTALPSMDPTPAPAPLPSVLAAPVAHSETSSLVRQPSFSDRAVAFLDRMLLPAPGPAGEPSGSQTRSSTAQPHYASHSSSSSSSSSPASSPLRRGHDERDRGRSDSLTSRLTASSDNDDLDADAHHSRRGSASDSVDVHVGFAPGATATGGAAASPRLWDARRAGGATATQLRSKGLSSSAPQPSVAARVYLQAKRLATYLLVSDDPATFGDHEFDPQWLHQPIHFAGISPHYAASAGSSIDSARRHLFGAGDTSARICSDRGTGMRDAAGTGDENATIPLLASAISPGTSDAPPLDADARGIASAALGDGVRLDPAPFQFSLLTPLPKIHYLFAIALFNNMFVTQNGVLCGVIHKDDLATVSTSSLAGAR